MIIYMFSLLALYLFKSMLKFMWHSLCLKTDIWYLITLSVYMIY